MSENICANWSISLNVDCPYCEHYLDVLDDYSEQEMYDLAEIGESKKFKEGFEVICKKCKKEFIVNEVIH